MNNPEENTLPTSSRIFPVNRYFDLHKESLENIEEFWARVAAENISWFKTWDKTLEWNLPFAKWFVGGKLNVSYNCLMGTLTRRIETRSLITGREKGEKESNFVSGLIFRS